MKLKTKKISIEAYSQKMQKIIAKRLHIYDTLVALLKEARKWEIKKEKK